MAKPVIWIIDTSVLLNILQHPERSQDYTAVYNQFEKRLQRGDRFAIPLTTIIETGNWAAKMPGGQRTAWSEKFTTFVRRSLQGENPFVIMEFPERENLPDYLDELPKYVEHMGLGDLLIRLQWEQLCASDAFRGYQINVWSLDVGGLRGLECNH